MHLNIMIYYKKTILHNLQSHNHQFTLYNMSGANPSLLTRGFFFWLAPPKKCSSAWEKEGVAWCGAPRSLGGRLCVATTGQCALSWCSLTVAARGDDVIVVSNDASCISWAISGRKCWNSVFVEKTAYQVTDCVSKNRLYLKIR